LNFDTIVNDVFTTLAQLSRVMSKTNAQFIDPRDVGRGPRDLKRPVFDENALSRADEAIKSLSHSFPQWLDEEVAKLQGARIAADAVGWRADAVGKLFGCAHDLKGLGATYGYPLVTQIAASLCRLVETEAGKGICRADPTLARAHVDAIRAAVRDQITTDEHPVGAALLHTLDTKVHALGVAPT
jgi:hypothetical protein